MQLYTPPTTATLRIVYRAFRATTHLSNEAFDLAVRAEMGSLMPTPARYVDAAEKVSHREVGQLEFDYEA